ncbi:Uncharacterized protein GBIM_11342 [Gryllus bimaculatus]|nr:Uncharacterized protein GBIM_11342 [Gryllus bimaculatus]
MGTHFYLLLLFQIICLSFIEAYPQAVKVSMAHTILGDHLIFKPNKLIQSIWQQEPAIACDIERPPVKTLTDKHILQFNFVPYLCVILYDASLRYLEQNTSLENTELNSGYAQEMSKEFSADTFCQKMKDNKWFTTVEENKLWVSNFSNDMKNKDVCQRYCVSDIVNPICAYTLWIDLLVKKMKHESLHPSSLDSKASHPSQPVVIPPKKKQTGTLIEKLNSKQVSDENLPIMKSKRLNVSTENRRPLSGDPDERYTSGAVAGRENIDLPLTDGEQFPATADRNKYLKNSHPDLNYIKEPTGEHEVTGENSYKKSELVQTENPLATSNTGSLPLHPDLDRTSGQLEYPAQGNDAPNTSLSQAPTQVLKPGEKVLAHSEHNNLGANSAPTFNSSKPEIRNPQSQNVGHSVSGPGQLVLTKQNGTSSSANPHKVVGMPVGSTGAIIGSSLPVSEREHNTERQEQVRGDHQTSANLEGEYESENRGHVDASKVASHGDSPKPTVPESPKIPVPSEEKSDPARVNTTAPEIVTKEVPGSTLAGLTDPKQDLEHFGNSESEAANKAIEGEGRAIGGEPDDHEEQNAMDGSQVENGDTLGDHGDDQTQDHDEAGLEMDQEFATEPHRYNEGENDEPSRPDGSTKLSNINNKDYIVSDEDEGPWPPGRNPINDAEGGYAHDRFVDAEDSHFFAYFMTMIVLCILGYLIFHNKQKILALALEGRVRKGTRRRPSTSGYRKLDSNLEEAVTSSCTGSSVTHVIY